MLPVVSALQIVVVVQVLQAVALIVGTVYLVKRLGWAEAESQKRAQAQARGLAAEMSNLEATVRSARGETASYLEAVFTGIQGLALNLDAARETSTQALEELKKRAGVTGEHTPVESADPEPEPTPSSTTARTLEEVRPADLLRLREQRSRRKTR
ncbi:MAG TPA: hypothetical protein VH083_08940 [Myxococcales bacterium]|jgi:uncharacterized membrane-anchored protein YhcB (DUF1043 family)|nr:hypothetical protein [Myxococcales bacterium]